MSFVIEMCSFFRLIFAVFHTFYFKFEMKREGQGVAQTNIWDQQFYGDTFVWFFVFCLRFRNKILTPMNKHAENVPYNCHCTEKERKSSWFILLSTVFDWVELWDKRSPKYTKQLKTHVIFHRIAARSTWSHVYD